MIRQAAVSESKKWNETPNYHTLFFPGFTCAPTWFGSLFQAIRSTDQTNTLLEAESDVDAIIAKKDEIKSFVKAFALMKELNQKRAQQKDNRDAGSSPVLKDSERPGSQESD